MKTALPNDATPPMGRLYDLGGRRSMCHRLGLTDG
jgi:hypothetical protein